MIQRIREANKGELSRLILQKDYSIQGARELE